MEGIGACSQVLLSWGRQSALRLPWRGSIWQNPGPNSLIHIQSPLFFSDLLSWLQCCFSLHIDFLKEFFIEIPYFVIIIHYFITIVVVVYACGCGHARMHIQRAEDNFWESALAFTMF